MSLCSIYRILSLERARNRFFPAAFVIKEITLPPRVPNHRQQNRFTKGTSSGRSRVFCRALLVLFTFFVSLLV